MMQQWDGITVYAAAFTCAESVPASDTYAAVPFTLHLTVQN